MREASEACSLLLMVLMVLMRLLLTLQLRLRLLRLRLLLCRLHRVTAIAATLAVCPQSSSPSPSE